MGRIKEHSMVGQFQVKRLRDKTLPSAGPDLPTDWFAVEMTANPELVKTKESAAKAMLTAFNARSEAQRFVDVLNETCQKFRQGK